MPTLQAGGTRSLWVVWYPDQLLGLPTHTRTLPALPTPPPPVNERTLVPCLESHCQRGRHCPKGRRKTFRLAVHSRDIPAAPPPSSWTQCLGPLPRWLASTGPPGKLLSAPSAVPRPASPQPRGLGPPAASSSSLLKDAPLSLGELLAWFSEVGKSWMSSRGGPDAAAPPLWLPTKCCWMSI